MKGKKAAKSIIYNAIILAIGLIMIYPLVWMIMSSFKETNIIFKTAGQLIPKKWVLDNYINGWKGFGGVSFGRFFSNSLFIAVVATIGTIVSSALVGFGFSRFQFRGKGILFAAMLASMMLPAQVLMIPQYLWYQKLGWVGSYLPLIVPYFFAIQGFFVYLIKNFIDGIPTELDEAAKIDGCSYYQIFMKIILPLLKPALTSACIFSFMWRCTKVGTVSGFSCIKTFLRPGFFFRLWCNVCHGYDFYYTFDSDFPDLPKISGRWNQHFRSQGLSLQVRRGIKCV